MTLGLGRNEKCHCGSGKKYKKCCMEKDSKRERLKQRVMTITRRDFISGPYRKCPNGECSRDNTFGVFMNIEGAHAYTRECYVCGHQQNFPLPEIKKKIVYIDQFVVSNLVKLLDKTHPSHVKVKSDSFWENLFIKLEKAYKSQAIICPDSFYHQDESLIGGVEFRSLKRLYEHFSSGKTLHPSVVIEQRQIAHHFEGWLQGEKVVFDLKSEDIAFDRNLHSWSVGLRVSVGGGPRPGQIDGLQKSNAATKEQLKNVWARWQTEKNISFIERVREETLGMGKGLITTAKQFAEKRQNVMMQIARGEQYEMNLDDFLPPMTNDVLESIVRVARTHGISEDQIPIIVVKYFNDIDALLEIPQIRISSVMFAGWAHKAASGKKEAPKSTTDVQFIASYLPYCDAMFVDKESEEILTQFPKNTPGHLRLREFPTKVFSLRKKQAFLDYLDQVVDEVPPEQIAVLEDMDGKNYAEPYWTIIEHDKKERELR